jgi:predicted DNA-binding ArsR family transcriptional regulator
MKTLKPFSKRTKEDIYLEYLNDWLTIKAMAENYGISEARMTKIIHAGQIEHHKATL